MELLYLWVEDFKSIKQQGFNFSSELQFETTLKRSTQEKKTYSVKISENQEYIKLFPNNFYNITGIVGKNGSGKSSLLNCIKQMMGQLPLLTCPLFFVLRDTYSKKILTYYYNKGGSPQMISLNVEIEIEQKIKSKHKIRAPKPYSFKTDRTFRKEIAGMNDELSDTSCCFYTNSFDSNREDIYSGIYNISTNFKIESFLKNYIEETVKEENKKALNYNEVTMDINPYPSHIVNFHDEERRGLVDFIAYAKTRKTGELPPLPKSLTIKFNFVDFLYLRDKYPKGSGLHNGDTLKRIHEKALAQISESNDKTENFINLTLLCSFYYVLRYDKFGLNYNNVPAQQVYNDIEKIIEYKNVFYGIKKILSTLSLRKENKQLRPISAMFGKRFITSVKACKLTPKDFPYVDDGRFEFDGTPALWRTLDTIHDLRQLINIEFVDYSWTGLSTGQEAYLSHFARLHRIKKELHGNDLMLLIDEGDLYFHPQWQKKYLNDLVIFCRFLFPKIKTQIIITTHSPFIVSDLPKQNLIFLNTDENDLCKVEKRENQSETFGTNIHELFANSFFIEGSLMGEFAKSKINEAMDWLNGEQSELTQNEVEKIIGIVGEPIIRTKLSEMLAPRLGVNPELIRLKLQQDYIDKRIKELSDDPNKNND